MTKYFNFLSLFPGDSQIWIEWYGLVTWDFGTKRFKTEDLAQERQGRASEVDNLQKQLSQSAAEAWLSALQQGVDFTTFQIFLYLYFFWAASNSYIKRWLCKWF